MNLKSPLAASIEGPDDSCGPSQEWEGGEP